MTAWRETMETLVRDRERALLGYAYLVCGDPHRAQDLVQEALVRTFARERSGLTAVKAEAYVRRAIATAYIDQYRRARRWDGVRHLFNDDAVTRDVMGMVEAGSDVADALATLPPRVRACVVLRFFDDLTVPQIAHQLGLAEGSVKRYLSDGLGQLELALGPLEAEETTTVRPHGSRDEGTDR
jgi:RNA polymerase sigma factor (sigma-70 family)